MNESAISRVSFHVAAQATTCDRCSQGIKNVVTVAFKDGTSSNFGLDCIHKVLAGDLSLKSAFNRNKKLLIKLKAVHEVLSRKPEDMPKGHEYYGSGLYFVCLDDGSQIWLKDGALFHPVYDVEKNRNSRYYAVADAAAWDANTRAKISAARPVVESEIVRVERFLASVLTRAKEQLS